MTEIRLGLAFVFDERGRMGRPRPGLRRHAGCCPSRFGCDTKMSVDSPSSHDFSLEAGDQESTMPDAASWRRARRRRRSSPSAWQRRVDRIARGVRFFLTGSFPAWIRYHRQHLITAAISFMLHLVVALLMALYILPSTVTDGLFALLVTPVPEEEHVPVELTEIVQPEALKDLDLDSTLQQVAEVIDESSRDVSALDMARDMELEIIPVESDFELLAKVGELGGRSGFGRQAALQKYGGNVESEKAVNAGLKWLQKIQREDGSWSFGEPGAGASPGNMRTTDMGATAMALLCFLGAGHTHRSPGPYQKTVDRGLDYLLENAQIDGGVADLRGNYQGNSGMYVQGIATICVCEAHAMEPRDRKLTQLLRQAVTFIQKAQNRKDGGWRYEPGQRGDTSVVGWQIMALQSAKSSGLSVSSTMQAASRFLDSVEVDDGAQYRYTARAQTSDVMTSVGLLCRMYMGWRRKNKALKRGVAHLAAIGPSRNNLYYNYYATQVIHHFGGNYWKKWNVVMRKYLVDTQIQEGPATGSWAPSGPHSSAGGQIYQTTLSLLTLEVYYRYLPIYRKLE